MNKFELIDTINRIQIPRNYNNTTLRLDMAERGNLFKKNFYNNFIKNKLSQLDFIAYPDYSKYINLEKKLLEKFKFPYKQVYIDAGSDSIIKSLIQTNCLEGEAISVLHPSFPMYSIYANSLGVKAYSIEYEKTIHIDINHLLKSINKKAKLLFISNPCSPFGNLYSDSDINKLTLFAEKNNFLVCLDEAYIDFAPEGTHNNLRKSKALIRLRTFSKGLGLAGARIGFCLASDEIIMKLKATQLTFPITGPSLSICDYILDNLDYVRENCNEVILSRNVITNKLLDKGFDVIPSNTNSIHFHVTEQKISKMHELIKRYDVLIKAGDKIGTPVKVPGDLRDSWIRMSIISKLENTMFFKEILKI